jgi:hypothetical protein
VILICMGEAPLPGCGRILTDEERHYYGTCCETCERAWGEAIESWRRGGSNELLDAMFNEQQPTMN